MDSVTLAVVLGFSFAAAAVTWTIAGRRIVALQEINASLMSGLELARQQSNQLAIENHERLNEMVRRQDKELEVSRIAHQLEIAELQMAICEKSAETLAVRDELTAEHATQMGQLREAYMALQREVYQHRLSAAKPAKPDIFPDESRHERQKPVLSVQVRPYVSTVKSTRALVFDEFRSAVGFQYQLMVDGVPCFQPHIVIDEEQKEKSLNDERLNLLVSRATDVVRRELQWAKAGDLISFAEWPILERKSA